MGKSRGSGESFPGGWEGRGQGTRPFPGLVWPPASSWPERSSQLRSVVVMCQLNPLAHVSLLLMGTVASLSWGRKLPAVCFPSAGNPGWWLARIPRSPWRICASSPRFCVLSGSACCLLLTAGEAPEGWLWAAGGLSPPCLAMTSPGTAVWQHQLAQGRVPGPKAGAPCPQLPVGPGQGQDLT